MILFGFNPFTRLSSSGIESLIKLTPSNVKGSFLVLKSNENQLLPREGKRGVFGKSFCKTSLKSLCNKTLIGALLSLIWAKSKK